MPTIEITVSRTKVVVPALRPEILHRARLLALFDDLLEKKLLLVTAPAGYGKTSLLIDFARQSEIPVAWLSLDNLDRDPQRFCVYLIAALRERFPKFGSQSQAVLRSLTSFEQDGERLLSTLVNEIQERIDEHFVLVLDDYHCIDTISQLRDFVSRFINVMGENCHVILSSRRLPALPDMILLVARQQVGGFDLGELAFLPEETRLLFEENYHIHLDDTHLEELMNRTEGWITGLHLSAASPGQAVTDLTRAARAAGVDLAGYFNQQVLAPQPPKMQEFLLQTSLLEEFDASLCKAVLGKGNWKQKIQSARNSNLFILPVGPQGKWLRYHPLFQEFLQSQMRQEEPEKTQMILLRLAEVYEQRGEWERAYHIYAQFDGKDSLAQFIERAGMPMLMSERLITFKAWLDELPVDLFHKRPLLLSLQGALLCALGDAQGALDVLDQAILEFRQADKSPDLALALVRRAATHRLLGDYVSSLQDAEEAMRLSENKQGLQIAYAEAERYKGNSLYQLGQMKEAAHFLEGALHHYELLPGEEQSIARLQMQLGMTYRANGNYLAARQAYEQALAKWKGGNNLPSQAFVLNSLGVLYHYQGEYEQAVRAFEKGLELARASNSPWYESLLLASLGDTYTDLDEFESADQSYLKAFEVVQKVNNQFLINYLGLAKARLLRLRGLVKNAHLELIQISSSVQASVSNYELGLFYLELGCLYLVDENPASAVSNLKQALQYFQQGNLASEIAWSQIWLCAAYVRSGEIAAARSCLQAAIDVGQSDAVLASLPPVIRQARPWLSALQKDVNVGALLTPWLESITQAERQLPSLRKRLRHLLVTIPIQMPHLDIRAFGRAQVRANGKLIPNAQWPTKSVQELFFYLVEAARPLSKEEIGETLWPATDLRHLILRFKNELYRLRHALGQDVVLFEENLYHFNHSLDYEYDVESLEIHLAKAEAAVQIEERISHLQDATKLRRGPYLQGMDAMWVLTEREHLDQSCLKALRQLVELQKRVGNLTAALQHCQDALRIDPYNEEFHRAAMQINAEQGNRLAVIWQYQACLEVLRTGLNVSPSDETEALYRQLTS